MSAAFFLGVDTETTGLDPAKGDRIIELAAIAYSPCGTKRMGALISRYDPERAISAGAQRVHGISYESLVGRPKFREHASDVRRLLLAAQAIIIHNAPFDLAFLFSELERAGILSDAEQLAICAKTVDTCEGARWATANGKSPSLKELCFATGQEYDPAKAHAAEYDVGRMMASFYEGVKRGFFQLPTAPTIEEIPA
jgi:DNA polymerase-3 subunit epsilon